MRKDIDKKRELIISNELWARINPMSQSLFALICRRKMKGIKVINDRIVLPATGLALIAWVVMVYVSGQSLLIPWVLLTAVFWLAAFLLGLLGYSPTLRKQIALAESAGANNDEYKSAAWRGMILGIVIGLVFLLILLLMAVQPALWS